MRRAVLAEINRLSLEQKLEFSVLIQEKLTKKLSGKSGFWAAYQPLNSEPSIQWSAVSTDIQWCFPFLVGTDLVFKHSVTEFQKNHWGFNEPVDGVLVSTQSLAGLVIPAVAFDKKGTRLGRGQGYFDRALKNYTGSLIGVCFHLAIKDQVFAEDHDLRCHSILTENKTFEIEGAQTWN